MQTRAKIIDAAQRSFRLIRSAQLATCLAVGLFFAPAAAAEQADEAAILGRMMGTRAVGLVRLDLAKITAEQLTLPLAIGNALFDGSQVESREQLVAAARALGKAGPRYGYLVVEAPTKITVWPLSYCVIPTDSPEQSVQVERAFQSLTKLMGTDDTVVVKKFPSAVVAGTADLLELIAASADDEGRDLAAIFAAAGDAPLVIALAPSKDQRRVIQELMPTIPPVELRQPVSDLIANLRWIVAAFDEPPQLALKVVAQYGEEAQAAAAAPAFSALALAIGKLLQAEQGLDAVRPNARGNQVVLEFDKAGLDKSTAFFEPHIRMVASAAARATASNRMKRVALAMYNYASNNEKKVQAFRFPDAASLDDQGRPLLSWRVLILPDLGEEKLFREFHLDEPWDSEHNKKLIEKMPADYRLGTPENIAAGKTCLVLPIGEETMYPFGHSVPIKDVSDGLSNTIAAVEANDQHAVTWTRPDDLALDSNEPHTDLGGHFGPGFLAIMGDGSVQYFDFKPGEKRSHALFTRAGGEPNAR